MRIILAGVFVAALKFAKFLLSRKSKILFLIDRDEKENFVCLGGSSSRSLNF